MGQAAAVNERIAGIEQSLGELEQEFNDLVLSVPNVA
jgi:seryl-tRNA synthetase